MVPVLYTSLPIGALKFVAGLRPARPATARFPAVEPARQCHRQIGVCYSPPACSLFDSALAACTSSIQLCLCCSAIRAFCSCASTVARLPSASLILACPVLNRHRLLLALLMSESSSEIEVGPGVLLAQSYSSTGLLTGRTPTAMQLPGPHAESLAGSGEFVDASPHLQGHQ